MNRIGAAAVVLEIAAGVAAQATGIGGPYVAVGAIALVILTAVYLFRDSRRTLVEKLRAFVTERRAAAPSASDRELSAEFELDTMECFRHRHSPELKTVTQRLVERGLIGAREQQRLNHPTSLMAIEQVADRLAELEALAGL